MACARDILQPDESDAEAVSSASSEDDVAVRVPSDEVDNAIYKHLIRPLGNYVKLLMDLCPTLEQTYRNQHRIIRRSLNHVNSLEVTIPALPYVNHVRDKFPRAAALLVERLGEANWQRHERLRAVHSTVEHPSLDHTSLLPKSLFQPASIFKDSALGSSISAQSHNAPTVASHSSFVSSVNSNDPEKHEFRVPRMPAAVEGLPLNCPYCSKDISDMRSRVDWKLVISVLLMNAC